MSRFYGCKRVRKGSKKHNFCSRKDSKYTSVSFLCTMSRKFVGRVVLGFSWNVCSKRLYTKLSWLYTLQEVIGRE